MSLALICVTGWSAASARAFPDKPLRIVIGFPAGVPLDQHARLLSERLQQVLGQPVLIDYKAGAGGTVGAQEVMRAPADGHTLMAGQVQFMAESVPQAANYHRQGKVRVLAVTSRERSPALPEIPTVAEAGLKDFVVVDFYGFLAPAGTPKAALETLGQAFKTVLSQPDIRRRMIEQGADPAFLGPDDFRQYLTQELPRWADAVNRSGARVD